MKTHLKSSLRLSEKPATKSPVTLTVSPKMIKWFSQSWMLVVYVFLYMPIVTLVIFSFNDSQLAAVWSHASLRCGGGRLGGTLDGETVKAKYRRLFGHVVIGVCANGVGQCQSMGVVHRG